MIKGGLDGGFLSFAALRTPFEPEQPNRKEVIPMAYTPELSYRGSATLRRLAWFSRKAYDKNAGGATGSNRQDDGRDQTRRGLRQV